jgi:hypothetical protein
MNAHKIALGLVAALAVWASAAADLVDNFNYSNSGLVQRNSIGTTTTPDSPLAGVINGEREVRMTLTSANLPLNCRWFVDTTLPAPVGVLVYNNDDGVDSVLNMNYGLRPDWFGEGPADSSAQLNANFFGDTAFYISVYSSDLETTMSIEVTSDYGEGGELTKTSPDITLKAGSNYVAYAPFSYFPGINWKDVDSVTFTVVSGPDLDIRFQELGTTPEPATLTLLGLGVLALARRRHRR